ncbi:MULTISPECIES: DUF1194 domain-containing protein [Rhodobacterales]|uniref:DUF1194 domain-containing protein n=1 Tax=Rhodobacterales TaxID=204455 RepID=UPI00215D6951|nr:MULTISPECIES: DUF1194 domain-containing protein [Rhodobacterales]MDO6589141.1 DUF1194 domain-containing protein [Yoonia sp. 1_MG-2023]
MVKATLFAGLCTIANPAEACRLALVLAVDVSSSIDAAEDQLQRAGLAAALIAPDVQTAFMASQDPVALFIFEWSGRYNQDDILPWTIIDDPNDLYSAAQTVLDSSRGHDDFPTAMGYALGHAAIQLQSAPPCDFHIIDVAGDGINNEGFGPTQAYAAFPFSGVTVNGLVVESSADSFDANPLTFYRDQVIRGPSAFVEIANGFADYENAMRRKLIREVTPLIMGEATHGLQSIAILSP